VPVDAASSLYRAQALAHIRGRDDSSWRVVAVKLSMVVGMVERLEAIRKRMGVAEPRFPRTLGMRVEESVEAGDPGGAIKWASRLEDALRRAGATIEYLWVVASGLRLLAAAYNIMLWIYMLFFADLPGAQAMVAVAGVAGLILSLAGAMLFQFYTSIYPLVGVVGLDMLIVGLYWRNTSFMPEVLSSLGGAILAAFVVIHSSAARHTSDLLVRRLDEEYLRGVHHRETRSPPLTSREI